MGIFLLVAVGAFVLHEIIFGLMTVPFKENMGCRALWIGCQESDDMWTTWLAFWRLLGAFQLCFLAFHARFNPNKLRRLLSVIQMALMLQLAGTIFSRNALSKNQIITSIGATLFLSHLIVAQIRSGGFGLPKGNPFRPKDAASQALLLHGLLLMATAGDLAVFRGFSWCAFLKCIFLQRKL